MGLSIPAPGFHHGDRQLSRTMPAPGLHSGDAGDAVVSLIMPAPGLHRGADLALNHTQEHHMPADASTTTPPTTSTPTRVYAYHCRVTKECLPTAMDQLFKAHQYRNKLVELERARRAAVEALLQELSPDLAALEQGITNAEQRLQAALEQGAKDRAAARKRVVTAGASAEIKAAKEGLKVLRAMRKERRTALFSSEQFKSRQEAIEDQHTIACKKARAENGLYWGTYLCVEDAAKTFRKGAPPDFHRFDGCGRLAVQVQGVLTASAIRYGDDADPRVQLDTRPAEEIPDARGKNPWRRARIRIGSDEKRKPVWCDLVVKMHRPLPEGAVIKWAWIMAKRIGTHTEWSLQFVVQRAAGFEPCGRANKGTAAIDAGWRILPNGDMRSAYWVGDDGQEGQVIIPKERLDRLKKVQDLQSIRDKNFDGIKSTVKNLLAAGHTLPPEIAERMQHLHLWKATAKLAAVAIAWRPTGAGPIYDAVEAWRKQDKHLLEWESHQRQGEINWRTNLYRTFAAKLSEQYKTVVVEDTDWRTFARDQPMEADPGGFKLPDLPRRAAAVSTLHAALEARMTETVTRSAVDTTLRCHACGLVNEFDAAKHLVHTCTGCGATWDQDFNACMNLLADHTSAVVS
jgi:hypothetical protein